MFNRRSYGESIEELALGWYQERFGGSLVARNYHCKVGEIDLVVEHESRLVFIEVRARRGAMESALESVSPVKRRRLGLAIRRFMAFERRGERKEIQLDVIGWDGEGFSHFPNIWLCETN